MKKLDVGDKVYLESRNRFGNDTYYRFETVERLTKTMAVLSNGTKLINKPEKWHYDKVAGYSVYGDTWTKWHIQTDEILLKAEKEKERQSINRWFGNQKFTDEEKAKIYNLLNNKS